MVVAPPSLHESGHVYEWLIPPETPLMPFEKLARLVDVGPPTTPNNKGSQRRQNAPFPSASPIDYVVEPRLSPDQETYLARRPSKAERKPLGIDGSAIEHGIICTMVNQDFSDGEILAWFEHHQPPKFSERGLGWFLFSLRNARETSSTTHPSLCWETGCISDEEADEDNQSPKRPIGWATRRWPILRELPEGLAVAEAEAHIRERFGVKRTQAQEDLKWLCDGGWLDKERDPGDGRRRILVRTKKAEERLASWGNKIGVPLRFQRGIPRPTAPKANAVGPLAENENGEAAREAEPKRSKARSPKRREPDPEAEARKAFNAEERRRERNLINELPRIYFGGRPTYLQLLTDPGEFPPGVLLHEQLRVGLDAMGQTVRRSFVSAKDPTFGGAEAPDPIGERVLHDGGYAPSKRSFAWAAELRKVKSGFEVATRFENGREVESVGLVAQAWGNFYSPLAGIPDVTGKVIRVVRKKSEERVNGNKEVSVRYRSSVAGDGLALNYNPPSLDADLSEMADPRHAEETLANLDDDWLLVRKVPWWKS
jgi:DNA-binding MarR family transcriptional regulator